MFVTTSNDIDSYSHESIGVLRRNTNTNNKLEHSFAITQFIVLDFPIGKCPEIHGLATTIKWEW